MDQCRQRPGGSQANATLIKGKSVSRIGEKLVKSDEGLTSDDPDSASKCTGLFVQNQLGVESRSYHRTLRLRSLTVRVTWTIGRNSGM